MRDDKFWAWSVKQRKFILSEAWEQGESDQA